MKFNRVVLIVISFAIMLLSLAGCGKETTQDSQKKLNVVATTTMLTDLVKKLAVTMYPSKDLWALAWTLTSIKRAPAM